MKACFALGPALRLLRLRRSLAVQAVAHRIDTWPASYSRYERGGSDMRCATLGRILDGLGAPLNELAAAIAYARAMGLTEVPDPEASNPVIAVGESALSSRDAPSQDAVGSGTWWNEVAAEWAEHWDGLWREASPSKGPRARDTAGRVSTTASGCDLDDTELVGQALRLLRLRREMEIEQVAERLGMYSQQLGAYENGSRGMLAGTLAQILENLGYSLVDLQEMLVLARYLFRRREPALPAASRQECARPPGPVPVGSAEWQRRQRQAGQQLRHNAAAQNHGATGLRLALFALGCRIWPCEREHRVARALQAATVAVKAVLRPWKPAPSTGPDA